jgi:hypothetical protein
MPWDCCHPTPHGQQQQQQRGRHRVILLPAQMPSESDTPTTTRILTSSTRTMTRRSGIRPFFSLLLHAKLSHDEEENNDDDDDDDDDNEMAQVKQRQTEINVMMLNQPQQQGTFFSTKQDDNDGVAYNAIPLFTGSLVLLTSIFFTGYGFFVFATGNDPIFQQ